MYETTVLLLLQEFGHVPASVGNEFLAVVDHMDLDHWGELQILEELEVRGEKVDPSTYTQNPTCYVPLVTTNNARVVSTRDDTLIEILSET